MSSDSEHWTVPEQSIEHSESARPARALLRRGIRALRYSSAYLALVGAAEVLVVTYLLSLPPSPAAVVVALVTFAVYANDRLVDVESDAVSNPARTAFVRRHSRVLYVSAALAYGLSAALAALGGPLAFAITLLPGLAWVLYAIDWLGLRTVEATRLKEIPVVSSALVAIAWSLAVVVLPVAFAGAPFTPTVGVLFAYFVLATFVSAEVSNVRDVASDTASGASTMATAFGVSRTRTGLQAISLVRLGLLGVAVVVGFLSVVQAVALAVGVACLVAVVALLGRTDRAGALAVAAECTRLPVLVALWLPLAL